MFYTYIYIYKERARDRNNIYMDTYCTNVIFILLFQTTRQFYKYSSITLCTTQKIIRVMAHRILQDIKTGLRDLVPVYFSI